MAKVKITLVKSSNSSNKNHIAIIRALGLHRIGQAVEHEAVPSIMGMVRHVAHLVRCEEA
jgi:large subunit ribosomal protein L30